MNRNWIQRMVALAAVVVALCVVPAKAQPLAGNVEEPAAPTVDETLAAALEGDGDAQLTMAAMYEELDSLEDAVRWYRKAAEQGRADAEFKLGYFHTVGGGGLARDMNEAAAWYKKAAEQNQSGAQYNLAVCYEKGLGVERDESSALSWYRKAAALGDTYAQKAVGVIHHKGRGVKADLAEAYAWYLLAASQKNADAARLLKAVTSSLGAKDLERGRRRGDELSMRIYQRTLESLKKAPPEQKLPAKKKEPARDFLQ